MATAQSPNDTALSAHAASGVAASDGSLSGRLLRLSPLHVAVLIALPFLVYANNYHHAYQLDDAYTLVSNPHVRSLLEVPRYFVDPSTYTSLREQADYRPLLQVTYALNYRMGGYDTWWWHFTQILLHALVTLGIYALCRRILVMLDDPAPERIALLAGVVFAIHPSASGVVNYLNARSSLMTAAFLLPALLAYMKPIEHDDYRRPAWVAAFFYALALFTKVEAVGVLGAFWAFDLWQRARATPGVSIWKAFRQSFDRRTLIRIAPALAVTIVYMIIRSTLMAKYPFAAARHAADVGPYQYFVTQLTAWWYYVRRWIAPVGLIADYASYPVYRSWTDPVVLLAMGGWIAVASLLGAAWRKAPYLLFLAIAAVAVLSPTSSIAPLAEMVNEHRPYLPIGIASLTLFVGARNMLHDPPSGVIGAAAGGGLLVVLISFAALTWQRNEVFATDGRYWKDILDKAPSARAHLNYGRTLIAANDLQGGLREFRETLELAPNWYFAHDNIAVAYWRLGQLDSARSYLDREVAADLFSGLGLSRRGEFHLSQGEYIAARDDFRASLPVSLERYRNLKGLATAYAGLGDISGALQQTADMLRLDSATALQDIPSISMPFFQRTELRQAGIEYFRRLSIRLPNSPWIQENIARLQSLAGKPNASGADVVAIHPVSPSSSAAPTAEEVLMSQGLALLYSPKADAAAAAAAAATFRKVLALNSTHYGAHYQLAVALDRAGRRNEARPVWERVLRMAHEYNDPTTAQTARVRLNQKP